MKEKENKKGDKIEERLQALLSVPPVNKDAVKLAVSRVFQDEVVSLKNTLLGISRGKIELVSKFMGIARVVADSLGEVGDEEIKQELEEESFSDRVKILEGMVRAIMNMTASATVVSQLQETLVSFEKSLAGGDVDMSEMKRFRAIMEQVKILDKRYRSAEEAEIVDGD